jgi:hypothetical protein
MQYSNAGWCSDFSSLGFERVADLIVSRRKPRGALFWVSGIHGVLAGLCSLIEPARSHTLSYGVRVCDEWSECEGGAGTSPAADACTAQPQPSPTGRMVGKRVSCVGNNCS